MFAVISRSFRMSVSAIPDTISKKLKIVLDNRKEPLPDLTGLTVEGFKAEKIIAIRPGLYDTYLSSGTGEDAGRKFLLRYFHNENPDLPNVAAKLNAINNPFLAPVSGFGMHSGHQYLARPFFAKSPLSRVLAAGTVFSGLDLKTLIIPAVVSALKDLHEAGLLLRNLSPGSLFCSDDGTKIVIADPAVILFPENAGFLGIETGVPPFYGDPGVRKWQPGPGADWFSLGITVAELMTGHSLVRDSIISYMSAQSDYAVLLPDNFPQIFKTLIQGLTYGKRSESGSASCSKAWQYPEVRRWLNGEDVPVPGEKKIVTEKPKKSKASESSKALEEVPAKAPKEDELIVPATFLKKLEDAEEHMLPPLPDLTGVTLGDVTVERRTAMNPGWMDTYLCRGSGNLSGKKFLLRYFYSERAVNNDAIDRINAAKNPRLAPVAARGCHEGYQYTAQPCYEMPALSEVLSQGMSFTAAELRDFIIPEIFAALKAAHEAGVIFRNLRCAGIYPDDSGKGLVLTDGGVSLVPETPLTGSLLRNPEVTLTDPGMPPFYSAFLHGRKPCLANQTFDYYAFGLVIYELLTGVRPLHNPDISEICEILHRQRLAFQKPFPQDIKLLITTLIEESAKSKMVDNDNQDGDAVQKIRQVLCEAVMNWLTEDAVSAYSESQNVSDDPREAKKENEEGDNKEDDGNSGDDEAEENDGDDDNSSSGDAAGDTDFKPIRFNHHVYKSEDKLVLAMLQDPVIGIRCLNNGELTWEYSRFSKRKGNICRKYESGFEWTPGWYDNADNIRVFADFIYELTDGLTVSFPDWTVWLNMFIDAGIRMAVVTGNYKAEYAPSGIVSIMRELISRGCVKEAAEKALKSDPDSRYRKIVFEDQELIQNIAVELDLTDIELALILRYIHTDFTRMAIGGQDYDSPDSYFREMSGLLERDKHFCLVRAAETLTDLIFWGERFKNIKSSQNNVFAKILECIRGEMFGESPWQFRDATEFKTFAQKLVTDGNPYEIRSVLNLYGDRLRGYLKIDCPQDQQNLESEAPPVQDIPQKQYNPDPEARKNIESSLDILEQNAGPDISTQWRSVNGTWYTPLKKGYVIKFGTYPCHEDGRPAPIEWVVLETFDETALLITKHVIDCRLYHRAAVPVTWETCDLRKWLNRDFFSRAFSGEEKKRILITDHETDENMKFGTDGGKATRDRIFCLETSAALYFFKKDHDSEATPTPYAMKQGAIPDFHDKKSSWWSRTPGFAENRACHIDSTEYISRCGVPVNSANIGIRPAMKIIMN